VPVGGGFCWGARLNESSDWASQLVVGESENRRKVGAGGLGREVFEFV
jgi:hypothetical protein